MATSRGVKQHGASSLKHGEVALRGQSHTTNDVAEVRYEGVDVHLLGLAVVAVTPALVGEALGPAHQNPVGRTVEGAGEVAGIHVGLQKE